MIELFIECIEGCYFKEIICYFEIDEIIICFDELIIFEIVKKIIDVGIE